MRLLLTKPLRPMLLHEINLYATTCVRFVRQYGLRLLLTKPLRPMLLHELNLYALCYHTGALCPAAWQGRRLLLTKPLCSMLLQYLNLYATTQLRFARLHGVRLVPEIDTPAHAASWCECSTSP